METYTDTVTLVQLPSGQYAAFERRMDYGEVLIAMLLFALLAMHFIALLRVKR